MIANQFDYLKNPSSEQLLGSPQAFLARLTMPTIIDIEGADTDSYRVIVTLIHGNEPSGLIALHRWILLTNKYGRKPLTNLRFVIASIEAAQLAPELTHRYLPGGKDLNRCFGHSKAGGYYDRARLIETAINEVRPELVVDLHNTSGYGPAFAVSTSRRAQDSALASIFCSKMIYTELMLGALMEQEYHCPTITIECGGSKDPQSHEIAFQGIDQLSRYSQLAECHHLQLVEVLAHPQRVRLKQERSLTYDLAFNPEYALTVHKDIEQMNFGVTSRGRTLGWLSKDSLEDLVIIDPDGNNLIAEYFEVKDNALVAKTDMQLFMATSVKEIALTDCLFYVTLSPKGTES